MSRKVVYLGMQYRGREADAPQRALAWVKYAVRRGYAPIVPWLHYVQALDDTKAQDRQAGIASDRELIIRCDEFWVCGNPAPESETWAEEHYALKHEVVVRRFTASDYPPPEPEYE